MKNYLRYGFIAVALGLMLASSATTTRAQIVNEVLKRMETHYKSLTSLRTNVTRAEYESSLKDTTTRNGKAIYLPMKGKNAYFRIDWEKPNESLAVIDKQYVLYQPNLKVAHTGSTDKAQKSTNVSGSLGFINMSKAQLKANYEIKYIGEETVTGGTSTWHLELTPKTAQKFKLADIWVDKDGMPVQIKLTAANNDTDTILLTGIQKNVTINGSEFKITPEAGTKIIKD
ncbi:MAG: outer membrane lipoprotein carrier protein LolA [Acidobacteria bacterium]|nr:outer membrane lipoprotein carrier protein LolA [Acidobacteriota bacterium]